LKTEKKRRFWRRKSYQCELTKKRQVRERKNLEKHKKQRAGQKKEKGERRGLPSQKKSGGSGAGIGGKKRGQWVFAARKS